jgi:carboxymethylenebutenolidase
VIGFYGVVQQREPDDDYAPIVLAPGYRSPVLGLFGGADQAIPTEEVDRFRQTLDAAGISNQIVSYEGAPHSFFDRSAAQHREASDDAWRRMLAFIQPGPAA